MCSENSFDSSSCWSLMVNPNKLEPCLVEGCRSGRSGDPARMRANRDCEIRSTFEVALRQGWILGILETRRARWCIRQAGCLVSPTRKRDSSVIPLSSFGEHNSSLIVFS
ncbi:hypothetical protein PILCRDRAFT_494465 [Piloderma croceum F 1598]|uniref:Uncharacterized protein n=1 Tax=Piloderma croceum (strain F 1598) TaxID=765440 RepID=A0A0C3FNY6_PILCF|nr:hypothetical protein PILCRDRAFT_494465 [Piloderma croceum F 1598]